MKHGRSTRSKENLDILNASQNATNASRKVVHSDSVNAVPGGVPNVVENEEGPTGSEVRL